MLHLVKSRWVFTGGNMSGGLLLEVSCQVISQWRCPVRWSFIEVSCQLVFDFAVNIVVFRGNFLTETV